MVSREGKGKDKLRKKKSDREVNGECSHAALGARLTAALMLASPIAYSLQQPAIQGSNQATCTQKCRRFLPLTTLWQEKLRGRKPKIFKPCVEPDIGSR